MKGNSPTTQHSAPPSRAGAACWDWDTQQGGLSAKGRELSCTPAAAMGQRELTGALLGASKAGDTEGQESLQHSCVHTAAPRPRARPGPQLPHQRKGFHSKLSSQESAPFYYLLLF